MCVKGAKPWNYVMDVLAEKNGSDTELLMFTMTLINKVNEQMVNKVNRNLKENSLLGFNVTMSEGLGFTFIYFGLLKI